MRLSEKIGIAAGFGFACRTGEGITNRFCIVNAGRVVANYDKIHPFSYGGECATYTGGNLPASVELFGEAIGLTVCYDMRFPGALPGSFADLHAYYKYSKLAG